MKYEYWFAAVKQISSRKKLLIREQAGSAEELFNIEENEWKKFQFLNPKEIHAIRKSRIEWDMDKEYEALQRRNIRFVPYFDERYPQKLLHIPDKPYTLYVKGTLPEESKMAAAIVGARECTPYGANYSLEFAEYLAARDVQIISGLARGIDGYAHRGALKAGGKTFAVMGCGVDICYPREHFGLYMDILESGGGILSEYVPQTPPLSKNFPPRNRLISGLSDVVLVMEARQKSGSLITADMALEQGKDVYALPGNIDSVLSQGCNGLIRQGAGILLSPGDLAENLTLSGENGTKFSRKNEIILERTENLVYGELGFAPKSLEELAQSTKLSVPKLTGSLVALELKGLISEISKNHYIKTR